MDEQDGGEEIRDYIQNENKLVYMLDNQMVEYLLRIAVIVK